MLAFLFFCFIVVVWVRFRRVAAVVDGLSQRVAQLEFGGSPLGAASGRASHSGRSDCSGTCSGNAAHSCPTGTNSGRDHLRAHSRQDGQARRTRRTCRTCRTPARDPGVPDRITLAALHRRHRHRRRRELLHQAGVRQPVDHAGDARRDGRNAGAALAYAGTRFVRAGYPLYGQMIRAAASRRCTCRPTLRSTSTTWCRNR